MTSAKSGGTLAIVQLRAFVEATRDSGYKNAAYAIAELIDNAVEAGAERVDIDVDEIKTGGSSKLEITVADDGCGMDKDVIALSLQFGGSTRFGSRAGSGRFGMGLPNSSLSQARKVEVTSWKDRSDVWRTYLDVDEVYQRLLSSIPIPRKIAYAPKTRTGTIVRLTRCDRLQYRSAESARVDLLKEIGRMFRHLLLSGLTIRVNQIPVQPIDPMFLKGLKKGPKGRPFGPPFDYRVRVPDSDRTALIKVTFSELPLAHWNTLSNQQKNEMGIAKGAGVSILRADREIDHGWFFMDGKRKENYDDWWRCEITFEPELDELFGVTHTKQGIRPAEELSSLLSPDIGRIARELNSRIRKEYVEIRSAETKRSAMKGIELKDHLLEPPASTTSVVMREGKRSEEVGRLSGAPITGLHYTIQFKKTDSVAFYDVAFEGAEITITLNEQHPFYNQIYKRIPEPAPGQRETSTIDNIRALLAAAARAEVVIEKPSHREIIHKFRDSWSNALVAFLS